MSGDKIRIDWNDIDRGPQKAPRPGKPGAAGGGPSKGKPPGVPADHPFRAAAGGHDERIAARMRVQSGLLIGAVVVALIGLILAARIVAARERALGASGVAGPIAPSGPASVCLVIDRSGSMAGRPLADAKQAAKDFMVNLKAGDEISVVHFGTHVASPVMRRQVKAADDVSRDGPLARTIDDVESRGWTALWDAGLRGVELTRPRSGAPGGTPSPAPSASSTQPTAPTGGAAPVKQPLVILLTDGLNNASSNIVDDLIDTAKDNRVIIHTVALGPLADRALLKRVAEETGGQYNYARSSSQLRGIYQSLGRGLH